MKTEPLPLRVLVVDDDHDTIESLALLLACWGHDARTALDGPTALEVAREYQPDVVLLDLAMPGMDGFEVARRLRQEVKLRQACIASLSGYGREADHRRALEAGCNCHFLKPISPEFLQEFLTKVGAAPAALPATE
jgi:CheY-like chemotaxis protein